MKVPQQPGYYVDRDEECRQALRAAFDALISECKTDFLDVGHVVSSLMPAAMGVGWTSTDIRNAVVVLAHHRQIVDKTIIEVEGSHLFQPVP